MLQPEAFEIDFAPVVLDRLWEVVSNRTPLRLAPGPDIEIDAGADFVDALARSDQHLYGINTGVGALCEVKIPPSDTATLQRNIIESHACGVGPWASEHVCRMTVLLKLLTFRPGHSGIRRSTIDASIAMWNAGIIPATPSKGSLGASGDLAPLSHLALPLLGRGMVYADGELTDAATALAAAGLEPITLGPKEGLALINGVQFSNAIAVVEGRTALALSHISTLIAAVSVEAFACASTFYDPLYHTTSAHTGQVSVAAEMSEILEGSNHASLPDCNRSHQDPYSFRCLPQVHGSYRRAVEFCVDTFEAEANSVGDNPLVFPAEERVLYGGNLHGAPVALALDMLGIAVTDLSSISERRTFQLLAGHRGLPDFLAAEAGLNTGYMIAQYTSAALLCESKIHATPASIDTIPTSQFQEDHVSMSGTAATKLQTIVDNALTILAIELLLAVQASEFRDDLVAAPTTLELRRRFRKVVEPLGQDRLIHDDLVEARRFVDDLVADWTRSRPA